MGKKKFSTNCENKIKCSSTFFFEKLTHRGFFFSYFAGAVRPEAGEGWTPRARIRGPRASAPAPLPASPLHTVKITQWDKPRSYALLEKASIPPYIRIFSKKLVQ